MKEEPVFSFKRAVNKGVGMAAGVGNINPKTLLVIRIGLLLAAIFFFAWIGRG